jgi:hypothetical protein
MGPNRPKHPQRRNSGTAVFGYIFDEFPPGDFLAHFPFSFLRVKEFLGLKTS